ncbi:hypothetical protein QUV16_23730, partial [Xanthomonas citri pv. citri]
AFNQNRGAGAVFRTIPSEVLTLEDLGCPPIFRQLIDQPQGLITRNSSKSTFRSKFRRWRVFASMRSTRTAAPVRCSVPFRPKC